jgi:hypothetical protein
MGDSGDQGQDTDEFTSDAELDQIAKDAEAVQGGRSNIVGSSSYDAQFTADNLEARGLDPQGFMSPSNFAQTTQGGAGGDDTTSTAEDFIDSTGISVPTVQAAGTSPTFSGAGVSDVFDPMTMQARSDTMVEALGAAPTTAEARGTPSFDAFGNPVTVQSFLPAAVTVERTGPQTQQQRGLAALAQTLNQARDKKAGMGDERGIDFGVTAAPEELVGRDIDNVSKTVNMFGAPGTSGADFDADLAFELTAANQPSIANITETALGARTPGTRTTATGTTTGDAQFGVSPGRLQAEFGPRVASLAGGLDAQKTADIADLTNRPGIGTALGLPSFARGAANFIGQKSRDRMAEAIATGRTDPLFGKGSAITDANLIRNDQGQVVGIRDNQGNLIEGMDPNAQMQQGDDSQQIKRDEPKSPDDPCPEGYKLIDGKCTLIETEDKGTGFITFPPDRDPPFQTGPFKPKSKPTPVIGIRGLNPITFNNPFRT